MISPRLFLLPFLAAPGAFAENLVRNGDFSGGAESWVLRLAPNTQATLVINEGEASILVVSSTASRWTINLEQALATPIRQGVTYQVSFDVRSDTPRPIDAVIRGRSGNILGAAYGIPTAPQRRQEGFTYVHKKDDTSVRLAFRLGGEATAITIDNVVFEPLPASAPPSPQTP